MTMDFPVEFMNILHVNVPVFKREIGDHQKQKSIN